MCDAIIQAWPRPINSVWACARVVCGIFNEGAAGCAHNANLLSLSIYLSSETEVQCPDHSKRERSKFHKLKLRWGGEVKIEEPYCTTHYAYWSFLEDNV
jgi:hypothetical protein